MPLLITKEREMRVTRNDWWVKLQGSIIGFDGEEGASAAAAAGAAEGAGDGTADGAAGDSAGEAGKAGEGDAGEPDTTNLKSALQKERDERKKLDKELKTLRSDKQKREDAEKSEVDRLKGENERNGQKTAKLAAGFKDSAIKSAILAAAGVAKFKDATDALRPEVIAAIGVEQDEDDPTQITIDAASVTAAVKKLAADKKHYIAEPERRLPKSGSSYGGSAISNQGDAEKQALYAKYPALRNI